MQIKFTVGPVYTKYRLIDATVPEIASISGIIRMATQARPEGFQFMPKYKQGVWDGYINLSSGYQFPTGLLSLVQRALPLGMTVEVEDHLDYPQYYASLMHPNMFKEIELRPYQLNAAIELITSKRGVAHMATNSGKTEVIAAMCKTLLCDILVVTTKLDLLKQTSQRLSKRLGEKIGFVGAGESDVQRVTVGMLQTLAKHDLKPFANVGCIIFDECHHVPSQTAQKVMLGIPAPLRYGFSGTPLHHAALDDLMLMAATGDVLVTVTNTELVDSGVSAKPEIVMYTVKQDMDDDLEWQDAYQTFIVASEVRNQIVIEQAKQAEGVTLVLVERIEHGKYLAQHLPESMFLHGGTPLDQRVGALDLMRFGHLRIVIATPIFDEGVDVPSIDTLVLAGGGVSPIKLLQRLGRGMRHKQGENVLHVIDFVDEANEYLLQHSIQRAQLYESEGFDVKLATPTQGRV
jgi:superfamily II DNA or RNA helicase